MQRFATWGICLAAALPAGAFVHAEEVASPRTVSIEVFIVVTQNGAAGAKSMSNAEFDKWLAALESDGTLKLLNRIKMSTLEGQQALVQFGERAPVPQSTTQGFGGRSGRSGFPRSVNYQFSEFGTLASAQARVADDGTVVLELNVEKSQLESPVKLPTDEPTATFEPPRTETSAVKSSVSVPEGATVLVGGLNSTDTDGSRQTAVLVRAEAGPAVRNAATAAKIRVFNLSRADAAEAAKTIETLLPGIGGAEIRISVDARTNSIIVSGDEDALNVFEALLLKLDESETARPERPRPRGFGGRPTALPTFADPSSGESANTKRAGSIFKLLDRDGDGSVSPEEWTRSRTIRRLFERAEIDLGEPMSRARFVENYLRAVPSAD